MKAPAFQFYPRDWDTDENVIPMSYEEEGVYFALCRRYWLAGNTLPSDLERLRRLLKGRPSLPKMRRWWEVIGPCFQVEGEKLTHKRLDAERNKQVAYRESKAHAGSLGGRSRSQRLAAARAIATHTKEEWLEMVAFFDSKCVKCGRGDCNLDKDHIIPIYQGGHDGISNIQPLCPWCNSGKGPERVDYRLASGKQLPSKWVAVLGSATAKPEANPSSSSSSAVFNLQSATPDQERARSRPVGAGGGSYLNQSRAAYSHAKGYTLYRGKHYDDLVARFNGDAEKLHAWLDAQIAPVTEPIGNFLRFIDERLDAEKRPFDRPFTAAERQHAERARKSAGGCRHDPPCESYAACLTFIMQRARERAKAS